MADGRVAGSLTFPLFRHRLTGWRERGDCVLTWKLIKITLAHSPTRQSKRSNMCFLLISPERDSIKKNFFSFFLARSPRLFVSYIFTQHLIFAIDAAATENQWYRFGWLSNQNCAIQEEVNTMMMCLLMEFMERQWLMHFWMIPFRIVLLSHEMDEWHHWYGWHLN